MPEQGEQGFSFVISSDWQHKFCLNCIFHILGLFGISLLCWLCSTAPNFHWLGFMEQSSPSACTAPNLIHLTEFCYSALGVTDHRELQSSSHSIKESRNWDSRDRAATGRICSLLLQCLCLPEVQQSVQRNGKHTQLTAALGGSRHTKILLHRDLGSWEHQEQRVNGSKNSCFKDRHRSSLPSAMEGLPILGT